MSEHQRRALVRLLSDEVSRCADREQLLVCARRWLYEHRLLIVHDRAIRALIAAALVQLEAKTAILIRAEIEPSTLERWRRTIAEPHTTGQTHQTWLWAPPAKHPTRQISEVLERIELLYGLDVHKFMGKLPDLIVRRYARRLASRPPSAGAKIKEPARSVEVACFLRYCLLTATDQLILMVQRRVADLWRQAAGHVGDTVNWAELYQSLLQELVSVSAQSAGPDGELRARLEVLVTTQQQRRPPNRASLVRERLIEAIRPVRSLLVANRQAAMAGHRRAPGHRVAGQDARSVRSQRQEPARRRLTPARIGLARRNLGLRPGARVPGVGSGYAACPAPIRAQRLGVASTPDLSWSRAAVPARRELAGRSEAALCASVPPNRAGGVPRSAARSSRTFRAN